MIKKFLFITFLWITTLANAQINEAGFFLGGSNYIGDIGSTNYINPNNFAAGIIYKYNLNPRIALRGTFTYAEIKSDDLDSKNIARQQRNLKFSNSIKELAVGVEFSFYDYDLSSQDDTFTPYLLLEFAMFNYNVAAIEYSPNNYGYENKTSYSIPFGVGYKTKLFGPIALGLEVGVRYTFSDDIDFNNPEIPALEFGNPNSNDWYVFSGINLVYTFGRPACYATPNK
ncbi:type IX secretion system protein PorG [Urechidicola croceus]|uniref:DUF6089 domain-containing protein n=1 Tax=Urechidicola croceus TaxID=1850246 RepID=A0A1D8P7V9_9FLAO|nr:DUF6089 family protein [Urechidicola croceus]AOW20640.1 hypothetical protein LPB138_08105 [Urechidicola croceus]